MVTVEVSGADWPHVQAVAQLIRRLLTHVSTIQTRVVEQRKDSD